MTLLFKLAWRNVWRNQRRSLIILTAIVIGVASLLLTEALVNGELKQMLENLIGGRLGHVQIHAKGFEDNKTLQYRMNDRGFLDQVIGNVPGVFAASPRVLSFGLISSASSSSGVMLMGVDPKLESLVSSISNMVTDGTYLADASGTIVLGQKLAEKLGVGVGDKVVLMASRADGHVGSDAFRICGIFQTPNSEFDRLYVHVPIADAQSMLGVGHDISEIAMLTQTAEMAGGVKSRLAEKLGGTYEVFTYGELVPTMILILEVTRESMFIYYVIIGLATIFGIINVLLMAVFERIREFGVVMAMGMRNRQVFGLILLEALLLGCVGAVAGVVVGLMFFWPMGANGIDLGSSAEAMSALGVGRVIYPFLTWENILTNLLFIPAVAVLAAIYPARKATRLEPVSAISYV